MTAQNNILLELKQLNSSLTEQPIEMPYVAPAGYFDSLADNILKRIKALEATNAADELAHLSPLLAGISKTNPYKKPDEYFNEVNLLNVLQEQKGNDFSTEAREELKTLSPVLAKLKNKNPYHVPQNYFETINAAAIAKNNSSAKIISFSKQSWAKYAVAASVVVAIASFFLIPKSGNPEKSLARIEKNIDKEIEATSDQDLSDFIEYTNGGQDIALQTIRDEEKDLLNDVSSDELQQFLNDVEISLSKN